MSNEQGLPVTNYQLSYDAVDTLSVCAYAPFMNASRNTYSCATCRSGTLR